MRSSILALALSVLVAGTAGANNGELAVAQGQFETQRARILKDLADGKTYAEIRESDRGKVRSSLARMSELLEGVESVDSLSDDRRIAVFNLQEEVNTILTKARRDSQVVCTREGRTGSNFKTNRCETVAARERRTAHDQDNLRNLQRARMPVRD